MARVADPKARGELVRAAMEAFRKVGLKRARVEDIAHQSGLAKGSFYLHFSSKEALFEELLEGFRGRLDALLFERERAVREHLDHGRSGPRLAELEHLHDRALLELLWEARDLCWVLIHGAQGTPFEGMVWSYVAHEKHRLARLCEVLKAQGSCRASLDSEVFASAVTGTYLLLAEKLCGLEQKPDLDGWLGQIHSLFREGFGAADPRAAAEHLSP